MEKDCSNILIVGDGAVASALSRKLSLYSDIENIYVASGRNIPSEFHKNVDLREDYLTALLKFALDYKIDLTIPVSDKALKSDIVNFFKSNNQPIFGPSRQSCKMMLNEITCKKFLYKINAQTPKFAVFNKLQQAIEYLSTQTFPVIISSQEPSSLLGDDKLVITSLDRANEFLNELFVNKFETDILIQDYIYGDSFTIYFITDGYSAIALPYIKNYHFYNEGSSGFYTKGIGACSPNLKISQTVVERVSNIVKNILHTSNRQNKSYSGIIGVNGILTREDNFYVTGLSPFFKNSDARIIFNLLEEDLLLLFNSCVNGSFSDDYQYLKIGEGASFSAVVYCEKEGEVIKSINKLEDIDNVDFTNIEYKNEEYKSLKGENFTLTRSGATLSRAKKLLYEDLGELSYKGVHYRKDF